MPAKLTIISGAIPKSLDGALLLKEFRNLGANFLSMMGQKE
jgi:hypothetical protein